MGSPTAASRSSAQVAAVKQEAWAEAEDAGQAAVAAAVELAVAAAEHAQAQQAAAAGGQGPPALAALAAFGLAAPAPNVEQPEGAAVHAAAPPAAMETDQREPAEEEEEENKEDAEEQEGDVDVKADVELLRHKRLQVCARRVRGVVCARGGDGVVGVETPSVPVRALQLRSRPPPNHTTHACMHARASLERLCSVPATPPQALAFALDRAKLVLRHQVREGELGDWGRGQMGGAFRRACHQHLHFSFFLRAPLHVKPHAHPQACAPHPYALAAQEGEEARCAPLRLLSEEEAVEFLWTGDDSVAYRWAPLVQQGPRACPRGGGGGGARALCCGQSSASLITTPASPSPSRCCHVDITAARPAQVCGLAGVLHRAHGGRRPDSQPPAAQSRSGTAAGSVLRRRGRGGRRAWLPRASACCSGPAGSPALA